ncbi:MAG: glycosyltransferase family 4 protein [Acidobacteriota bacterium]
MNILYVSQYFPPEVCAPAIRVNEFTQAWARCGHKVRVLTGFPNHPEGHVHPDYRRKWRQGFAREDHAGVEVLRTWLLPAANRGVWGRAANYSSFALSAILTGPFIAQRRGVVIGTSPQLLVAAAGYVVARSRALPFVFEVRDLWPQSIAAVGAAGPQSGFYRSLEHLANFLYRHADRIVLDGDAKRRQIIAMGVSPHKTAVIRNGASEDFCFGPESAPAHAARERVRHELGLDRKFIAMYVGTLGMAHGLETVLQAAERLKARSDIAFVIIGEGAEREHLLKKKQELQLSNVLFLGKQPRKAIPAYLAAADICLAPLRKREMLAMAAGRPVILGVEGEAKEILMDAHAGIPVPPENPKALADAVLLLREKRDLRHQMGLRGRYAVLHKYSRPQQAAAYIDLLDQLVPVPPGRLRRAFHWGLKIKSGNIPSVMTPKSS